MYYAELDPSQMTLRDHLARDRTVLANERTLLAYLRTAIALFAAGGTLLKVFPDNPSLHVLGIISLILGGIVLIAGLWRFFHVARQMRRLRLPKQKA